LYLYNRVEEHGETNWAFRVKNELNLLGFGELWINQYIDHNHLPIIKQRLLDQAQQFIRGQISESPKCIYYKYMIDVYCLQYYLSKFIPAHFRKYITKFRLSSHKLAIETGRYHNTDRSDRVCFVCGNVIEDEFHFILVCPLYINLRKLYIQRYYWKKPSVFKLINVFNIRSIKHLRNLGIFLYHATNLRNSYI